MDPSLASVLLIIGFAGSFFAGMLGIGGAMIMVPLLLYVPAMLGAGHLDMKTVSAITIVQVLVASLSGVICHLNSNYVSRPLIAYMGTGSLVGALAGAVASHFLDSAVLSVVFAGMLFCSLCLMLLPAKQVPEDVDPARLPFNRPLAFGSSLVIGNIAGMVGAGGAGILVAVMWYLLRLPTRVAIGSSLGIMLLTALAGTAGKVATGQVQWALAIPLAIASLPGAYFGARASYLLAPRTLRVGLALLVSLSALRVSYDMLPVVASIVAR